MSVQPIVAEVLPDLAPEIYRQRLVVEGVPAREIDADQMVRYLRGLADVCDMVRLMDPVTHCSSRFGWAGWVHWETSGAHMYAWERPRLFFSVDIYTCKAFDVAEVVRYTAAFFEVEDIVSKSF